MDNTESWTDIFNQIGSRKHSINSENIIHEVEKIKQPTVIYFSEESMNRNPGVKPQTVKHGIIYTTKSSSDGFKKQNDSHNVSQRKAKNQETVLRKSDKLSDNSVPPPLPISPPPSDLVRFDSTEFLNDCGLEKVDKNGNETSNLEKTLIQNAPIVMINNESNCHQEIPNTEKNSSNHIPLAVLNNESNVHHEYGHLMTSSPLPSDTESDDSDYSDISGHYNLCAYSHVFKTSDENQNESGQNLPYQIGNLKNDIKTVRSKIKPGTVEDMKQIFAHKGKRHLKKRKSAKKYDGKRKFLGIKTETIGSISHDDDKNLEQQIQDTNCSADDSSYLLVTHNSNGHEIRDTIELTANDRDGCFVQNEKDVNEKLYHSLKEKCSSSSDESDENKNSRKIPKHPECFIDENVYNTKGGVVNTQTTQNSQSFIDENLNNSTGGDVNKQNKQNLNENNLNVLEVQIPDEPHTVTTQHTSSQDLCQTQTLKLIVTDEQVLEGQNYLTADGLLAKEKTTDSCVRDDTINKPHRTSAVDFDSSREDDMSPHACLTSGGKDGIIDGHMTSSLTNIHLSTYTRPQQDSNKIQILTQEDVKSNENITSPSLSTEGDSKTATTVVLRELRSKMPEKSSGIPKTSESSEYIGGRKVSTKITTSRSYDGGDVVQNSGNIGEDTAASDALAALAEAVAKINEDNKDEILPEINQSVTKLNGGNLVITTLTRKIVEEENVDEGTHSPGRVSPVENKNQNVYIVQDHKGDTYMVEDITDDSQESAYFSSTESRHASESSGHCDISGYSSPQIQGVHNLQAVGRTGIDYSTAEEVLLGLFNPNHSGEIVETGEYNYEKTHSGMSKTSQLQVQPYGYATDSSFNKKTTTLEEYGRPAPQVNSPMGGTSVKTIKSSYEMSVPWGFDGTEGEEYDIQKQESVETTDIDHTGMNSVSAAYLLQSSYQVPPVFVPPPVPYPMITPLVIPEQPSIRLHKLDVTPNLDNRVIELVPDDEQKKVETETVECKNTASFISAEYKAGGVDTAKSLDEVDSTKKVTSVERPVYKTVALVKGPYDTPKWTNSRLKDEPDSQMVDTRRYKILNSRASEETRERSMTFDESQHAYRINRTENYENEKKRFMDENQNFSFSYSSPKTYVVNNTHTPRPQQQQKHHHYKTEKHFQINGTPDSNRNHTTHLEISRDGVDGGRRRDFGDGNFEMREEKRYVTKKEMKADEFYRLNTEPIHLLNSDASQDMHVVRGNILIKNTLEDGLDEFNDNINVFDKTFNLTKENPLYQSDEDLHKRFESERVQYQNQNHSVPPRRDPNRDMTFETVDRYTTTREVKREPEKIRPRQNFSQMLLSKLSTIDSKDIRQHIDVKHHNEEIYGDISFIHADGSKTASGGTQNFDSVSEDIDLALRNGKAYITVKVTAERISPLDLEFNIWRKNQAIVTRLIEIDLLANEQRRRLYHKVMGTGQGQSDYSGYQSTNYGHMKPQETILSSSDTLNLFAEIMNATDGEGDHEDITVKTSQRKTVKPSDFLY